MKINIQKQDLITALQMVTPITDKNSSKPILSNFLLTANQGGDAEGWIDFSATDYEISIEGKARATVEESGSVCISAKRVLDVCREFQSDQVSISSDDQLWVTLEGGTTRLRLPSVDTGLYPQMEQVALPNSFKADAALLKRCIELTIFAAQTNETRKNLMGVCLRLDDAAQSVWTATDGHRLAQVNKPVEMVSGENAPEIIVPRKSLVEMQKVLERSEGDVEISFDERNLMLRTEGLVLLTRLIEGKFPNVDPVIPKDNDKQIHASREQLVNALRIVSLMSAEKIKPVKLSFSSALLKLESERAEYGEVNHELPVEYEGEAFSIGFNARYLLDVLQVMDGGDQVTLEMKGALNPCLLKSPKEADFLSVVMPLRIEW